MPQHDPTPEPVTDVRAQAWVRFKAIMSWMALAAVLTMAAALLYLWLVLDQLTIGWAIGTLVGVGLTVLLGTGLMALVYFSDRSGIDAANAEATRDRYD